jgi:PAS domain S-box-containing protein
MREPQKSELRQVAIAAVLATAIFLVDLSLPLGIASAAPYVVIVLLGWWTSKPRYIFGLAAISSAFVVAGWVLSPEGGNFWVVLTNRFLALFSIWLTAALLFKMKGAATALQMAHDKLELQSQAALFEVEQRFRAVVNNSPTKIHIKDADGRFVLVNREAEKIFGVTDEEARGKTTHEIFPNAQAGAFRGHDQAVLESGRPIEQEEEWLREDGSHTYLTVKFPISDASGKITGVGAIGTDITERKKAEEALRESEQRSKAALDTAGQLQGLLKPDGTLVEANTAALSMIDASRESVVGQLFWDCPWWQHDPDLQTQMKEAVRSAARGETVRFLATHLLPDKRERYIDFRLAPIFNEEGEVVYLVPEGHDVTDLKEAERAVARQATLLSNVLETANQGIGAFDDQYRLIACNKNYRQIFSFPDELAKPGQPLRPLTRYVAEKGYFGPGEVDELTDKRVAELTSGKPSRREIVAPNGRTYLSVVEPRDDGGSVSTYTDITERKRAEEDLKLKDQQLSDAQRIGRIGHWSLDVRTGQFECSAEIYRLYGLEPGSPISWELVTSAIHEEDQPWAKNNREAAIAEKRGYAFAFRIRQINGVVRFVEGKMTPVFDAAGECVGFFGVTQDITERKRIEDALRESESALRDQRHQLIAMMNAVPHAVITIDMDSVIHSLNPAAERIFGYSVGEIIGQNVGMLMPEPLRSEHDNYIKNFLETGGSGAVGKRREVTGQRKDGTTFPLEIAVNWMEVPEGVMFVGVCQDITRRKQAEKEKAEMERDRNHAQKLESLGTLAGGIAHEINTPVQFIGDNTRFLKSAFADLSSVLEKHMKLLEAATSNNILADAVAEVNTTAQDLDMSYLGEEIPAAIDQSLEGLDQVAEIVKAIKEFSYPNANEKSAADINKAIATTVTVSRNQWKYAAELETDLDTTLPLVPCLLGEFNQVMLNLIVNAAHAIEDSGKGSTGRITISTRRVAGWAEVRVSDTGTGIPEENHDKIFEPFFTTKEPGRGTGQGLTISHTIITKKHGGTFTFQSEVGEGTEFIIGLPLVDSAESEVAA